VPENSTVQDMGVSSEPSESASTAGDQAPLSPVALPRDGIATEEENASSQLVASSAPMQVVYEEPLPYVNADARLTSLEEEEAEERQMKQDLEDLRRREQANSTAEQPTAEEQDAPAQEVDVTAVEVSEEEAKPTAVHQAATEEAVKRDVAVEATQEAAQAAKEDEADEARQEAAQKAEDNMEAEQAAALGSGASEEAFNAFIYSTTVEEAAQEDPKGLSRKERAIAERKARRKDAWKAERQAKATPDDNDVLVYEDHPASSETASAGPLPIDPNDQVPENSSVEEAEIEDEAPLPVIKVVGGHAVNLAKASLMGARSTSDAPLPVDMDSKQASLMGARSTSEAPLPVDMDSKQGDDTGGVSVEIFPPDDPAGQQAQANATDAAAPEVQDAGTSPAPEAQEQPRISFLKRLFR
jgi:hypothetical protein